MQRSFPIRLFALTFLVFAGIRPRAIAAELPTSPSVADETVWDRSPPILEAVLIRGNRITAERIIRRELVIATGGPFDEHLARISRRRLMNLGYFRSVDFQLQKGTQPGFVALIITVEERETVLIGEASFGGSDQRQFNGNQGFGSAGLSVSDINLGGSGQVLTASLASSRPNLFAANLRWTDPWIGASPWSLSAEYGIQRRDDFFSENLDGGPPRTVDDLLEIETDRQTVLLGAGYRVSNFNALFAELGQDRLFAEYAGGNLADFDRRIKVGASQHALLRLTFRRDSRNDPFIPTEGQTIHAYYEWGAPPLTGHYLYNKVGIRATQYLPVRVQQSLAFTIESGYVDKVRPFYVGFAPSDRLPNDGLTDERLEGDGLSMRSLLLSQDYKHSFASTMCNYTFPIYSLNGPFLYRLRGALYGGLFDSWDSGEAFFDEVFVPTGLGLFLDTAYGILNLRFSLNFAVSGEQLDQVSRF